MKERTGTGQAREAALVLLLALTVAAGTAAAQAPAGEDAQEESAQASLVEQLSESSQQCLSCHEFEGMTVTFQDGVEVDGRVDPEAFARSVHGRAGLDCQTCHVGIEEYPHPEVTQTLFDWLLEQQQICAWCHSAGEDFSLGAHGRALTQGDTDVPNCTTCHGEAHAVQPVSAPAFRGSIVDTCASCHANDELMAAHGVKTGTVSSYLAEFHGLTATLLKESGNGRIPVAVCSDCHGAHAILPPDDPNSTVFVTNLAATCRKCHPDATNAFATAWSMHNDPESHPLVGAIAWFYRIVTGVAVLGFMGYIVLELAHHRAQRKAGRGL